MKETNDANDKIQTVKLTAISSAGDAPADLLISADPTATIQRPKLLTPAQIAARITTIYWAIGIAWIMLSDRVLAWIWPDQWLALSSIKGVFFVICTGAVIYVLIQQSTVRRLAAETKHQEAWELCVNIIKACPSAILLTDTRRVRLANPASAQLLGIVRSDEMKHKNIEDFIHPSEHATHHAQLQALMRQDVKVFPLHERRFLTVKGQEIPVDVAVAAVTAGNERLILFVMCDATERKQQLEALIDSERLAAAGRIAAGAAHDFANFIAAISNCNAVLRARVPSDPEALRCLDDIDHVTQRGHALAYEMIALSGARPLSNPEPQSINQAIRDAHGMLGRLLPNAAALTLGLDASPDFARLHANHIDQLLLNLVTNARDASPPDGSIHIATRNDGPQIVLSVEDHGAGMTPDIQAQILKPFFSTKHPERGSGLGLVTVARLVDLYKGTLQIQSTPGQGTRVEISLPACEPPPRPPKPPEPPQERQQALACRLLLVDDEQLVRRPLARLLKSMGYEVTEATGGTEALSQLDASQNPFDLILSDVDMPGMSGLALAEALQKRPAAPPLVLMSGYSAEPQQTPNYARFWLQKPFGPDLLRQTLLDAKTTHSEPP